jgi:hypothetical protein
VAGCVGENERVIRVTAHGPPGEKIRNAEKRMKNDENGLEAPVICLDERRAIGWIGKVLEIHATE